MKLRISEHAEAQLAQISDYGLKTWGQEQSLDYIAGILNSFERLCDFPESGRVFTSDWPFMKGVKLRYAPYRSHKIFYMIDTDRVLIIAIGSHWQMPDSVLP